MPRPTVPHSDDRPRTLRFLLLSAGMAVLLSLVVVALARSVGDQQSIQQPELDAGATGTASSKDAAASGQQAVRDLAVQAGQASGQPSVTVTAPVALNNEQPMVARPLNGPLEPALHGRWGASAEQFAVHDGQAAADGAFQRERLIRPAAKTGLPVVRLLEDWRPGQQDGDVLVTRQAMVANRLLVRLAAGTDVKTLRDRLQAAGFAVHRRLSKRCWLVDIGEAGAGRFAPALARLKQVPGIGLAEPDYIVHAIGTPDDSSFAQQWGLHNTGQTGGTADADIDAVEAWDLQTDAANVIVAVIDTGVDHAHPDLADNMWVNSGEVPNNGLDDDNNGYVDDVHGYDFVNNDGNPTDDHYHGTHVAGTIGARGNNSAGVTGVCWRVQLMALKFLGASGSGTTSDAIAAVNYATANGAHLSNNSWGGGAYSELLRDAIADAHAAGSLFVAAAGNNGVNISSGGFYPASYDVDNIIVVAATDHNDQLASFSNYGLGAVDVAAPGVAILSTFPAGSYDSISGTSMAAPHVAGALALVKGAEPGLSAAALKDRLLQRSQLLVPLLDRVTNGRRLNLRALLDPSWNTGGDEVLIHDVGQREFSGDGDGQIEAGETVALDVTLFSTWANAVGPASVRLENLSAELTAVSPGPISIPSLASMTPVPAPSPLTVQCHPDLGESAVATLELVLDFDGGEVMRLPVEIAIGLEMPQVRWSPGWKWTTLATHPVANVAYLARADEPHVYRLDLDSMVLTHSCQVDHQVAQFALSPDGTDLFIGGGDRITRLNSATLAPVSSVRLAFDVASVVCGAGGRLYIATTDSWDHLVQMDADTGKILGYSPNHFYQGALLQTDPEGDRLFVGERGLRVEGGPGYLLEYDISAGSFGTVSAHYFWMQFLRDYKIDEPDNLLYTMNSGIYGVQLTDLVSGEFGTTWRYSPHPYAAAVDRRPGSDWVFAAPGDASVVQFQRGTGRRMVDHELNIGSHGRVFDRGLRVGANGVVVAMWESSSVGSEQHVAFLGTETPVSDGRVDASLLVNNASGTVPFTVSCDASASQPSPAGTAISTYSWYVDDGRVATGASASFSFDRPGVHQIYLTVTDDAGRVTTTRQAIRAESSFATPRLVDGDWSTAGGTAQRTGSAETRVDYFGDFELLWDNQEVHAGFAPVIENGRIAAVADWHGTGFDPAKGLWVVDQSSGETIWDMSFGASYGLGGVSMANGQIFMQFYKHGATRLICFDAIQQRVLWKGRQTNQFARHYAPAVAGPQVYAGGGFYGGLYSFDRVDGSDDFFISLAHNERWSPSISEAGDVFTFVSAGLRATHPIYGDAVWSASIGAGDSHADMNSYPVMVGDHALVLGFDDNDKRLLACVQLSTRTVLWTVSGDLQGAPAVRDGIVYMPATRSVVALSLADGSEVLRYPTAGNVDCLQPVVTADALFVSIRDRTQVFRLGHPEAVTSIPRAGELALSGTKLYICSPGGLSAWAFPNANGNNPPDLQVTASPRSGPKPLLVSFDASATTDPDGDTVSFSWDLGDGTQATGAVLQHTYTQGGAKIVRLLARDGRGGTAATTITIDVETVPVALDQNLHVLEGRATELELEASDEDGDALTFTIVDAPEHGSVTGNGAIRTYTPNTGYLGPDSIRFRARDDDGNSAEATISITVAPFGSQPSQSWATLGRDGSRGAHQPATQIADHLSLYKAWEVDLGMTIHEPVVAEGKIFASRSSHILPGLLVALDGEDGNELWRHELADGNGFSPPSYADGHLYLHRRSPGELHSIEAINGAAAWQTAYPTQFSQYLNPLVVKGRIYGGGGSYTDLYVWDQATGAELATSSLPQRDRWAATAAGPVIATYVQGTVRGHDPVTAAVVWSYTIPGYSSAGTPVATDETVFVIEGGVLYAIDSSTGNLRWSRSGNYTHRPAIAGGLLYVANPEGVEAMQATDGRTTVQYELSYAISNMQPVVTNNMLIFGPWLYELGNPVAVQRISGNGTWYPTANRLFRFYYDTISCYTFDHHPDNAAPTAKITASPLVDDAPVTATFSSAASTDPDGDSLTTTWHFGDGSSATGTEVSHTYSQGGVYLVDCYVHDGRGGSDRSSVEIKAETTPVASDADLLVHRDRSRVVVLQAVDEDGDELTYDVQLQPRNGTLTGSGAERVYTPNPGYVGTDVFTFVATDGRNQSNRATVALRVEVPSSYAPDSWPTPTRDRGHTSSSPLAAGDLTAMAKAWTIALPWRPASVVVADNIAVAVSDHHFYGGALELAAYAVDDGRQLWLRQLPEGDAISQASIVDGYIYFARYNHRSDTQLMCINLTDGQTVWSSPFQVQFSVWGAPLVDDARVSIGGGAHNDLIAFDRSSGAELWNYRLPSGSGWSPSLCDSWLGTWVNKTFRLHSQQSGSPVWTWTPAADDRDSGTGTVVYNKGRALVRVFGYLNAPDQFHALDVLGRRSAWSKSLTLAGPIAADDDYAYLGEDGAVQRYALTDGTEGERYALSNTNARIEQVVVLSDALLVRTTYDINCFALGDASGPRRVLPERGPLAVAHDKLFIASRYAVDSQYHLCAYDFSPAQTQPPVIDSVAVTPDPVTGVQATVTATASDPDSAADSLRFRWSVTGLPTGAPTPLITPNDSHAAATASIRLYQSGTYQLQLTVTDPDGLTDSSPLTVQVQETATSLQLTVPGHSGDVTVETDSSTTFQAQVRDQFGNAMQAAPSISWLASIGAVSSSTGASTQFLAPGTAGSGTVTANAAGLSASRTVHVVAPDLPPVAIINPVAEVTDDDDDGVEVVTLTSAASDDQGIASQTWKIDGTVIGTGVSVTHDFAVGDTTVDLTVIDTIGQEHSTNVVVTVRPAPPPPAAGPNFFAAAVSDVGSSWQTVTLPSGYTNPVIIATVHYGSRADKQALARIRSVGAAAFELRVENPSGDSLSGYTVRYLVAESGSYDAATHGITAEVRRITSTRTDAKSNWPGQSVAYVNTYSSPVVLGQVQTATGGWSAFWCRGSSQGNPPSASRLSVGKHVGEDPVRSRPDEELGVVIVEAGIYNLDGFRLEAAVGSDSIVGIDSAEPKRYALSGGFAPEQVLLSPAGMDGGDGQWPVLVGDDAISADGFLLACDEDSLGDAERAHTTEQIAYFAVALDNTPPPPPPPPPGDGPRLHSASVSGVGSSWQTVSLPTGYTDPVVIATVMYADRGASPALARLRNVSASGFELRVVNPDGSALSGYTVQYLTAEVGVYTAAEHGVAAEVKRVTSTRTDAKSSWSGQALAYDQVYTAPVVLGQLQTSAGAWASFWARGSGQSSPPSAASLYVGKHVGEDPVRTRPDESIGLIILEAGVHRVGAHLLEAGVGADTVIGIDSGNPRQYGLTAGMTAPQVLLSSAAMDGGDGGWPVLVGPNAITGSAFALSYDEDTLGDGERKHTTEQVAYLAIELQPGAEALGPTYHARRDGAAERPSSTRLGLTLAVNEQAAPAHDGQSHAAEPSGSLLPWRTTRPSCRVKLGAPDTMLRMMVYFAPTNK